MEEKFILAWANARKKTETLGIRLRPIELELKNAKRCLSSHRESDGFFALADKDRLDLSLEALAIKKQFTPLFTDEEANAALDRLLAAGYGF